MKFAHLGIGVLAITLFYTGAMADTTVTGTALGISVYLPDNWTAVQEGDTCMTFSDTTFMYRSQITCKKQVIASADYPLATSWTRSHFIAYLLVVQYSYDPFGAVLYFDSSSASTQGSLWAPEAFTEFYTLDTVLGAWNEYMRYTETGSCGYEIYAIGDTADMKQNIGMYMAIIRMIQLGNLANAVDVVQRNFPRASFTMANAPASSGIVDLLGKRRGVKSVLLNGVYYRPETGKMLLTVK